MADILKDIAAAKSAGYTIKADGHRWCFVDAAGTFSAGSEDETTAWVKAAAHHKKMIKAGPALKYAVLGASANIRGARCYLRRMAEWKAVEIVRETPTMYEVSPASYYDKKKKKAEVLKRFATMEEAQAFIDTARAAVAAQEAAARAAQAVVKDARETAETAERALRAAIEAWVQAQEPG